MARIIVVPYENIWPDEFQKIKSELESVLGGSALAVEHVGSTSVPGLDAKPVIDIDVVIEISEFDKVKQRLESIGYSHRGDLGVTGREAFGYEGKEHLMKHHLYVCDKNADELMRHLTFRDHLRQNENDRQRYAAIKREMAAKYPFDIDSYIDGKQPVVLDIYKKCGIDISMYR